MHLKSWRIRTIRPVRPFVGENQDVATALKAAYESLPTLPVTPNAAVAAVDAAAVWSASPKDGVDSISRLPVEILRNIVSRLPVNDAVSTSALASRWRDLWRDVPLVFSDIHLVPECKENLLWRPGLEDTFDICNALTIVLAEHPGPFRCVHITCCYLDMARDTIQRWLMLVAKKGVEELAFINRPWPINIPLPATLFSCTSLTRLHIGAWKFPNTTSLREAASFPHLQELFLSLIVMNDRDLAFLLDRSPVLEVLTIISSQTDVHLRLVSQSLRCLQLALSSIGDIFVADAPHLERLLLWMTKRRGNASEKLSRIEIGKAPNLTMLGYLHPGQLELCIGDIEADTNVSPSTIIPSVRILALDVDFEICSEVKTVPALIKCFPNIDTLHIKSLKTNKPRGMVNFKFWLESCPIECVQHVKKLVIHEFQGKRNELAFIRFMGETVKVLEEVVILLCPQSFSSANCQDANRQATKTFKTVKWANKNFKEIFVKLPSDPTPRNFRMPIDVLCRDPFDLGSAVGTF